MYTELDPRQDMQPHLPRLLNRDIYYKGQTIIEQGADGCHAYYIEKGRVEVLVHDQQGHEIKVSELGPGEIFGEMALIEHEVRSATIRAIADTTITVIPAADLEKKMMKIDDKAVAALVRVFIDRLRQANLGQLKQYRHLAEFQDRIAGLVEKAGHGISDRKRAEFRSQAEPLLEQLEELLDKYKG